MQRALATFNAEQAGRGRAALEVGIGLHSGEAVAGTIGSLKKLEFTVLGDTVNVASRLEGLCKLYHAGIVASRAVVDAAGSTHPARRIDRAIVQGREVATDVCEILDVEDPRAARVPTWERALTMYYERRFGEAAALFEEAARGLDDPGAAFQIERCRVFAASPPPPDWTGVERRAK
jgi:hypothetical protein